MSYQHRVILCNDLDLLGFHQFGHPLCDGGFVAVNEKVHHCVLGNVGEHTAKPTSEFKFVNAKPYRGFRHPSGVQVADVLKEDIPDRLFVQANVASHFGEGAVQGSTLDVLQKSPGHHSFVVQEVERLEERLSAFQAFVPLASDSHHRTLAVDRGVDEALDLNTVPLQLRPLDTAADTELNGAGVLGGNNHVVLIFLPIQHVTTFNSKNVGQETRITRSDSSVLDSEYQRSTNAL